MSKGEGEFPATENPVSWLEKESVECIFKKCCKKYKKPGKKRCKSCIKLK